MMEGEGGGFSSYAALNAFLHVGDWSMPTNGGERCR